MKSLGLLFVTIDSLEAYGKQIAITRTVVAIMKIQFVSCTGDIKILKEESENWERQYGYYI